jgi:adenylate cyclase
MKRAVMAFARYVPVPVVKALINSRGEMAQIQVERRQISIFFSDVRNFTTLCETLEPARTLALLTEYFDEMEIIVSRNGGTILEFVGDAILAVWNAPSMIPNHAVQCLKTALEMNERLEELRTSWVQRGFPEIFIRSGAHTAPVFHGNIGSHQRLKYGVLGDGVNLASRLEELNKRYGTLILTTSETKEEPNVWETFLMRPVDVVVVKGKSQPTTLWEVVAVRNQISDLLAEEICSLQSKALDLFLNQDFEACCEVIQALFAKEEEHKKSNPHGKVRLHYGTASTLHMRAKAHVGCQYEEWSGAETLDAKRF